MRMHGLAHTLVRLFKKLPVYNELHAFAVSLMLACCALSSFSPSGLCSPTESQEKVAKLTADMASDKAELDKLRAQLAEGKLSDVKKNLEAAQQERDTLKGDMEKQKAEAEKQKADMEKLKSDSERKASEQDAALKVRMQESRACSLNGEVLHSVSNEASALFRPQRATFQWHV